MWKDKLTEYNGKAITYDEIGNPLTYGTGDDQWSFSWEHGRQLASLTTPEHTISYKYNADGLRTQKTVDGVQWEYVWDGDKLIYMYDGTAEWRFIYDAGGSIVGFMQGASTYYYKKNLQGDIISIFDNNFNEVVTYEYDSWGNLIAQGGSKAAAYVKLGKDNPIRYRGYFYDTDTGLYYLQSRYYNADWGRFINADDSNILSIEQGKFSQHNLFTYCLNDPVNDIDPTGYLSLKSALSKVKELLNKVVKKFNSYLKNLIVYNKSKKTLSISTSLISTAIDTIVAIAVKALTYKGLKLAMKVLLRNKSIRNSFIKAMFDFFLKTGVGKLVLKTIFTIGYNIAGKKGGISTSLNSMFNSFLSNIATSKSKALQKSSSLISAFSSIGGIVAFFLDLMDKRWDDYATLKLK